MANAGITATPGMLLLAALVGLVVGSFVNLVAVRLPAERSLAWARSRSDCCDVVLSARELVPVVSWLVQDGKCARCRVRLSVRHPLVELAGAAIGVWAAIQTTSAVEAVFTALFGWQLLLLSLVDADELWLPDRLTAPLLATGLMAAATLPDRSLSGALVGAVVGFIVLWAVSRLYRGLRQREGLGGGDPFLFGAIGTWVGWIGLPSVLLWACAGGLSWVAARRVMKRPMQSQEPLPFGPFLAIGGWLTWLYGPIGLS